MVRYSCYMSAGKFMLVYLQRGAYNLYPEIITWELQKADDQEGFISVLGIKKKQCWVFCRLIELTELAWKFHNLLLLTYMNFVLQFWNYIILFQTAKNFYSWDECSCISFKILSIFFLTYDLYVYFRHQDLVSILFNREVPRTSNMELSMTLVNGMQTLTNVTKNSILDVRKSLLQTVTRTFLQADIKSTLTQIWKSANIFSLHKNYVSKVSHNTFYFLKYERP